MKEETYSPMKEFQNPKLEAGVLKRISEDPESYHAVETLLSKDQFPATETAYESLVASVAEGEDFSYRDGAAVEDIFEAVTELERLRVRRVLAGCLLALSDELKPDEVDPKRFIHVMEVQLSAVKLQVPKEPPETKIVAISDLMPAVLKNMKERYEMVAVKGKYVPGVGSGFTKLDEILGGLQSGIHSLSAEPGAGKTSLVLQISRYAVKEGVPVLFVTFEEPSMKLSLKSVCATAGLEMKRFMDGRTAPENLEDAINKHIAGLDGLYFIDGTSRLEISTLEYMARKVMKESGANEILIVIDYLQRWAGAKMSKDQAFRHDVTKYGTQLREVSTNLNSPVIVISSQNRAGEGKAHMTSLKESGEIEYISDSILFLVKDEGSARAPSRNCKLVIEKNRYGDRGYVKLIFNPHIGTFTEV